MGTRRGRVRAVPRRGCHPRNTRRHGAHKELRLRKPSHRAAEMRAVDSEDGVLAWSGHANIRGNLGSVAIPGLGEGIVIANEGCLADRELIRFADIDPAEILLAFGHRPQNIRDHWNGDHGRHKSIQSDAHAHEKRPAADKLALPLIDNRSWNQLFRRMRCGIGGCVFFRVVHRARYLFSESGCCSPVCSVVG